MKRKRNDTGDRGRRQRARPDPPPSSSGSRPPSTRFPQPALPPELQINIAFHQIVQNTEAGMLVPGSGGENGHLQRQPRLQGRNDGVLVVG